MKDRTLNTIEIYDKMAEEYSQLGDRRLPIQEITKFIQIMPSGAKVLDAGCGFGKDIKYLSDQGFQTTGIDLSKKLIMIANKLSPKTNFLVGDIRKLPFKNEDFDGIWCNAALLHLSKNDTLQALGEFNRVLKKDGLLFILVKKGKGELIKEKGDKMGRYFTYFTEDELYDTLPNNDFDLIDLYAFNEREKFGQEFRDINLICCFCKKSTQN